MDNIRSRIRQIMMSEFDCEEGELTDSLGLDEILMDTWDWANLRDALEECFHVEVPDRLLGVRVESPLIRGFRLAAPERSTRLGIWSSTSRKSAGAGWRESESICVGGG